MKPTVTNNVIILFLRKILCVVTVFLSVISVYANYESTDKDNIDLKEHKNDVGTQNISSAQVYISEGAIISNIEELKGNFQIINKTKSERSEIKQTSKNKSQQKSIKSAKTIVKDIPDSYDENEKFFPKSIRDFLLYSIQECRDVVAPSGQTYFKGMPVGDLQTIGLFINFSSKENISFYRVITILEHSEYLFTRPPPSKV
jgi:hypothetical protein